MNVKIIESLLERIDQDEGIEIPREEVKKWLSDPDLEVAGIAFFLLVDPAYSVFIRPPLPPLECREMVQNYFARCLEENPLGKWAHSRESAGYALATWFRFVWEEDMAQHQFAQELKEFLERQYITGGESLRTCIAEIVLGTLFEDEEIKNFFVDWLDDPDLEEAFTTGEAIASGGGNESFH